MVAPDLESELGTQYLALYKIVHQNVEVPDSWVPHKIIKKESKKLFK